MTLRVRLTAYYTLFFALALLLLGIGLYLGVRQLLLRSVLDEVRVGSSLIQDAYARNEPPLNGAATIDPNEVRPPEILDVEAPELYVQVADKNGAIIERSANAASGYLPIAQTDIQRALNGRDSTDISSVGRTRVVSLISPLRLNGRIEGALQVAQSLRQVDRLLTALLWALIGGGVITLLAAARGSLWLAHAALQPIDQVSATASRIISAEDLHERVPGPPASDELGRLTQTINLMLERMERVFRAQQRFTADVAHELRTPLAAMRGNLEILRRGALRDPQMLNESLQDIESEVARLTRLANDLLVLAQADAGLPLRMAMMQMDEVVLEVYRELRPLAQGVRLELDLQDEVELRGDRDRLKQALLNVVANAIRHTPAGGRVVLSLKRDGDRMQVAVQDTGVGIPPEQQEHIFERFFRGDESRAQGGAGLGLAIVKWVAESHGGSVSLQSAVRHGTRVTLTIPLHPALPAELPTIASTPDPNRAVSAVAPTDDRASEHAQPV